VLWLIIAATQMCGPILCISNSSSIRLTFIANEFFQLSASYPVVENVLSVVTDDELMVSYVQASNNAVINFTLLAFFLPV